MIVFARGLVVSPYARDMSSMIFTNTYRPDTSSGRRILPLCCMTEEHDLSARAGRVVTESLDRHRIYEPDAHGINLPTQYITPVHRSCPRPPSDTRYSLSRAKSQSSATACPEGSTGRSRLCRRSKRSRTRHGPYERTSEPKAHARPSMWRPCSPDGEVCIGPRPPLRDSAPYSAKTASPLELTLRTFFLHT